MPAQIVQGEVVEKLRELPDNVFHAAFCDPPYGLSFMGRKWDYTVPTVETWEEILRVLKPGAPLLAFGGSRTYHRIVCNIEDAGFEIRDCLQWLYGSGFPKGQDISKAIDRSQGNERPIIGPDRYAASRNKNKPRFGDVYQAFDSGKLCPETAPGSQDSALWSGYNTTLKPAHEPICLARKSVVGSVADNVLTHGTGGLAVSACEVGGKWPANVLLDEIAAGQMGTNSRFFYCAKANQKERGDNKHPTVKPLALCEYLAKLILPPKDGVLLVPFSGSGSEVLGALRAGWPSVIGIEREEEYAQTARKRLTEAGY